MSVPKVEEKYMKNDGSMVQNFMEDDYRVYASNLNIAMLDSKEEDKLAAQFTSKGKKQRDALAQ